MKNLSRGQRVALLVAGIVVLASGAVGTIFGVRKHNAKKAVAAPAKDAPVAE